MEIPKSLEDWKTILGLIAILGAFYLSMFTESEAEEMRKAIDKDISILYQEVADSNNALKMSINRSEIMRLKREIRRLTLELHDADSHDAELIRADIKYYEGVIACIRAVLPLCE